jgi:hypothetical protein
MVRHEHHVPLRGRTGRDAGDQVVGAFLGAQVQNALAGAAPARGRQAGQDAEQQDASREGGGPRVSERRGQNECCTGEDQERQACGQQKRGKEESLVVWLQAGLLQPLSHKLERAPTAGTARPAGEVLGYGEIAREYYERYRLPIMHTETNLRDGTGSADGAEWLWRQWESLYHVRNSGLPTVGFTWYSLTDQIDWDTALREENGHVNPVGLFDLERKIRPVGEAYKRLISEWQYVLPARSVCLTVPIVMPSESDEPFARRRREWMRKYYDHNQGSDGA